MLFCIYIYINTKTKIRKSQGQYLLFLISASSVPSISKLINVLDNNITSFLDPSSSSSSSVQNLYLVQTTSTADLDSITTIIIIGCVLCTVMVAVFLFLVFRWKRNNKVTKSTKLIVSAILCAVCL